jgi:type II secretory pathway pseudopilin PulG
MVTAVTIIGILIAAAVIAAVYFANRERRRSVREFNRRHASTYRLNRLNQQTFNKAFNIVSDLVKNDGADIEVMFDNQVVFNGYIDITELGEQPQFWYNKALLDKYGIEY